MTINFTMSEDRRSCWTVSEPPGNPSGATNFDIPLPRPAGVGLTATRDGDGDGYVPNGRKYWPSSVGWDEQGVNAQCVIVRTNSEVGGTEGLSSITVQRARPVSPTDTSTRMATGSRPTRRSSSARPGVPADNLLLGAAGQRRLLDQRQLRLVGLRANDPHGPSR